MKDNKTLYAYAGINAGIGIGVVLNYTVMNNDIRLVAILGWGILVFWSFMHIMDKYQEWSKDAEEIALRKEELYRMTHWVEYSDGQKEM